MSLINKIAISNVSNMNGKGSQVWEPRFRYEVLNCHGQSTAMNLVNGGGKTTLTEGILAVLSRDRKLVTNTKSKFSPPSCKVWSHLQIELIMPHGNVTHNDMLTSIGGDMNGETWVFGICGHRGPQEAITYYYYPGTLNDLPIGKKINNEVALTNNRLFKETRQSINGIKWGVDKVEWLEVVGRHLSMDGIKQLVAFQKKGGSDKSAQLFNFKIRPGESYAEAFFYEVLAPAIMADLMYKEGEEDEHFLEDTIYETIMRVVRAKRKTESKRKDVEQQEAITKKLDGVVESADKAVELNQSYQNQLKKMALDVQVLTQLVKHEPLPGIPYSTLPEGLLGDVARHIIIEPGKDLIRLTDRGLSTLLGIGVNHVNEHARRNRMKVRKISQVIDITCDFKIKELSGHGGSRQVSTSYTITQAKEILQSASKYGQNLTQDSAIAVLEEAESWFERNADTNPYRAQLVEAKIEHEFNLRLIQEIEESLEKQHAEKDKLVTQQREIKDNEAIYNELCKCGLFTDDELAEPRNTGEIVKNEFKTADTALKEFNITAAKLENLKPDWELFIKQFPDDNPHDIDYQYKAKKKEFKTKLGQSRLRLSNLENNAKETEKDIRDREKQLENKELTLTRFDELKNGVQMFKYHFDDMDPIGLDQKLIQEHATHNSFIDNSVTQIEIYQQDIDYIHKFNSFSESKISPQDWLDKINIDREILIADRNNKEKQLTIYRRQREALENERIAASELLQIAIDTLTENSLSHSFLHEFIQNLDISGDRINDLLASFSSLLFAPVFDSEKNALKAVELLQDKELPVPIFLSKSLKEYCHSGNINQASDNKLYVGIVAGTMTRQVECLIDPTKVEREKESLDQKINYVNNELSTIKIKIEEISSESEAVFTARKAKEALDNQIPDKLKYLLDKVETIKIELTRLTPLIDPVVINAIRDMQSYNKLGGEVAVSVIQQDILLINSDLVIYKEKYHSLTNELEREKDAISTFQNDIDNIYPEEISNIIQQAIRFWNQSGPEFLISEVVQRTNLENEYNSAQARNEYSKFCIRAQQYLDAISVLESDESIDKRLVELDKSIASKNNERASAKDRANELQNETLPRLRELVLSLDTAASIVLAKYKKVAQLSGDINKIHINKEEMDAHPLWVDAVSLKHTIAHDSSQDNVVNNAQLICDKSDDINIEDSIGAVKRAQAEASKSEKEFIDNAHNVGISCEGLAPSEKERMISVKSIQDSERISSFYKEFLTIFHKSKDEFESLERSENETRMSVADHTAFMINQATHSLSTLKSVVKKNHGSYKSYFIVDAEMIDRKKTAELIERIVILLDTQEKHREEDKTKGTIIENDAVYKNNLRTTIKDVLYRSIFSKPTVKFVNERIRPKGEHDFDSDLSEGEKTALSLMWTIRLAEFAIEREVRKLRTTTARQKARSRAENILIIDGLFSNLSEPALIESVMAGIEDTRGRFQLIGLIHHPQYKNDFNVFPVLLLGKKHVLPGGGSGWVSFSNDAPVTSDQNGYKSGTVGFAEITRIPPSPDQH